MRDLEVAVLGAGVIGLNTVLRIREEFPSAKITLIDEKLDTTTLSYGPAGIFRPSPNFGGLSADFSKKLIRTSYEFYRNLLSVEKSGVTEISGYIFSNTDEDNVKNKLLEDLLPVYRDATPHERNLHSKSWRYGAYYETIMTQCRLFLPWALDRFKRRNGNVIKRRINHLKELEKEFDVVFNCTGLAAKYLCNDPFMVPIRGQLVKVYAPWVNQFFYNDYDTYILPVGDGIVSLGGTRNYHSFNSEVDHYDTLSILERCSNIIPSLVNAEIVDKWVGLRPHRNVLRLEMEQLGLLKIVHNYGHGGYGITTGPGTADYAVRLFRTSHSCNSKL